MIRLAVVDRSKLAGVIPMTRRWWDCGNGWMLSTIVMDDSDDWQQVAVGRQLARPGRLRRLFRSTEVMADRGERYHTRSEAEVWQLIGRVAALPPWGLAPGCRVLPPCRCEWCPAGVA